MKRVFWILFVLAIMFVVPLAFAQGETPPINVGEITVAKLGAIIAGLLSLALDYVPGLAAKWDVLEEATKKRWMAAFALVIVAVLIGLTCFNIILTNIVCTRTGVVDAIYSILYVYVVGQGVHLGTKPTSDFKSRVLKISPKVKH